MYDPIELSNRTENIVTDGTRKKYYRFRPTGFYGGIATADTVGCNLRCKFCWSGNSVWNAKSAGEFYSPAQVADKLNQISKNKGYSQVRVSGGEPTIGCQHLIMLLENLSPKLLFILETNGILLGADNSYLKQLSKFSNIHVRVCLKGCNPDEFSMLTGAERGFDYQLRALENLRDEKINFNIALVSVSKNRQQLFNKLIEMNLGNIMVEEEEIKLYPSVLKRLSQEGLLHHFDDKK